jgi:hypothetical protein
MWFRVLTERKNKKEVLAIFSRHFAGFTVLEGDGLYEQKPEPSLILEVESNERELVNQAALEIKIHNNQHAVMVQQIPNDAWLV